MKICCLFLCRDTADNTLFSTIVYLDCHSKTKNNAMCPFKYEPNIIMFDFQILNVNISGPCNARVHIHKMMVLFSYIDIVFSMYKCRPHFVKNLSKVC